MRRRAIMRRRWYHACDSPGFPSLLSPSAFNTHRGGESMNKVATSTTQVACAGLLLLCWCVVTDAQTAATSRDSTKQSRATLARGLRDSLSLVLRTGVVDRAFPGAYA